MNARREDTDLITRACAWLGRRNFLSPFLDWVAGWFIGPLPPPALQGALEVPGGPAAEGPPADLNSPLVQMPRRVLPWTHIGNPQTEQPAPAVGNPAAQHHTPVRCGSEPKYRGMHGRPCKFVMTGLDTLCPKGTEAGLWWVYKVGGTTYCYVDCCGQRTTAKVWCNWTKENNWCGGKGHGKYTCTLTVEQRLLVLGPDNFPTGLEQPGAPPLDANGKLPGAH